jgi:hypothetical protein
VYISLKKKELFSLLRAVHSKTCILVLLGMLKHISQHVRVLHKLGCVNLFVLFVFGHILFLLVTKNSCRYGK